MNPSPLILRRWLSLVFAVVLLAAHLRGDDLGKIYDPAPQNFREAVEQADLIKIRTGGVPSNGSDAKLIMTISGEVEVRQFLAPFQLYDKKVGAARCDCSGDPAVEIYRGGKLITAFSFQHGVALSWPDNWPAHMLLPRDYPIDEFYATLAKKGFPQYQQAKESTIQLAKDVMQATKDGATGDTPVRKLQKLLQFSPPGWEIVMEESEKLTLWDKDKDQMVFYKGPPRLDQPDVRNLDAARGFLRTSLQGGPFGMVEVETVFFGDVAAQWVVMKERQGQGAFTYQSLVFIPTQTGDIVINIMSKERGDGGPREVPVLKMMHGNKPPAPGAPPLAGFFKDPYDGKFDSGALYSISDDRKYDADNPNHPLSRTRRKMTEIIQHLKLPEEIRSSALFQTEVK